MAVITKYVVVRNGVELDKEFLIKKEADAYDKMLDAAENLSGYIKDAGLKIDVDDETIDSLSVFLAKNGPGVHHVAQGEIDDAVAPGKGDRRLGPALDQRSESGAAAAGQQHGQGFLHAWPPSGPRKLSPQSRAAAGQASSPSSG